MEKLLAVTAIGADRAGLVRDLSEAVTSSARKLGGGRPSFRNPSLSARAGRQFSELSGDDVRQGSLYPPTPVQRQRYTALELRAGEAMAALERETASALAEVNALLEAVGTYQIR